MLIRQFVDEGLGNTTHLVISERTGAAAIVVYETLAAKRGHATAPVFSQRHDVRTSILETQGAGRDGPGS